jgi:hypothetical protein
VKRRIFKTRINVGFFKVGEVLEDLLRRHPSCLRLKDVLNLTREKEVPARARPEFRW